MFHGFNEKVVMLIQSQAIKDAGSWTAAGVDTAGWDECSVYFALGATDIAMAALKLQESATSGSGYADVTGGDYSAALPAATDDNKLYAWHVKLDGRKRYINIVATAGDGSAGSFGVAFAVLRKPAVGPTSASGRGLAAEKIIA